MAFFLILAAVAAVGVAVVSLVVRKRSKREKPREYDELKSPTAGEARFMTVVFGTVTLEAPNVIAFHDKNKIVREVTVS